MKKKTIAFVLCAVMLFGAAVLPAQAASTYAQEVTFLGTLRNLLLKYSNAADYTYFDIDRDGTQELIVRDASGYSDILYDIYLIKNFAYQKTDTIASNYGYALELFVPKSTGKLTMYYRDNVSTVNLVNGKVSYSGSVSAASGYDSSDTLKWTSWETVRFPALTDLQKLYVQEMKTWFNASNDRGVMIGDIDNDGFPDMVKTEMIWTGSAFLQKFYICRYNNGVFVNVGSRQGYFSQDGGALMQMYKDGGLIWFDGNSTAQILRIAKGELTATTKKLYTGDPFTEVLRESVSAPEFNNYDTILPDDAELKATRIPGTPYRLGDPDGDGYVTAADARLALRRSVELETYIKGSKEFAACDVDCSGTVSAADARTILRTSVGLDSLTGDSPYGENNDPPTEQTDTPDAILREYLISSGELRDNGMYVNRRVMESDDGNTVCLFIYDPSDASYPFRVDTYYIIDDYIFETGVWFTKDFNSYKATFWILDAETYDVYVEANYNINHQIISRYYATPCLTLTSYTGDLSYQNDVLDIAAYDVWYSLAVFALQLEDENVPIDHVNDLHLNSLFK